MNPSLCSLISDYRSTSWNEFCDWYKLNGWDWRYLLTFQPQFSEFCDWSKLNGYNWRFLLIHQPQFHEHCDWSKLDGYDWCWLLVEQPQLSEFCDWSKLSGYHWNDLLERQPQFAEFYDWSKLDNNDWKYLLKHQPQFGKDRNRVNNKNWQEFWISMAEFVSNKSKDRSTKVGCVITSPDNKKITIGYNGFPAGIDDENDAYHQRPLKYKMTEHAERNAIYNASFDLKDCVLYTNVGVWVCTDCARAIIQSGIKTVVGRKIEFPGKGDHWGEDLKIAQDMLKEANVKVVEV